MPADDEVVAEVHHEVILAEELARDEHRVRQAERRFLLDVGGMEAERGSVADCRLDRGSSISDDDAHVGNPRLGDRLKTVKQHRLVRDRQQLFRGGVRDRP